MQNEKDYIETNGASLTVDVEDASLTDEEARRKIQALIQEMELEDKGVVLSRSSFCCRITVRVKGDLKKIEDFHNAILESGKYCVKRRISLAY